LNARSADAALKQEVESTKSGSRVASGKFRDIGRREEAGGAIGVQSYARRCPCAIGGSVEYRYLGTCVLEQCWNIVSLYSLITLLLLLSRSREIIGQDYTSSSHHSLSSYNALWVPRYHGNTNERY
jgi:hypothetical protein